MTNKEMFKGVAYKSLEEQVGGKHYRSMKIQPAQFINENKLLFEGETLKEWVEGDFSGDEVGQLLNKFGY